MDCNDPCNQRFNPFSPSPSSNGCGSCCQTIPISQQQLSQLITVLTSLKTLIPAYVSDPSDENRLALLNVFTQLLDLFNSLIPSPEGNYVKQFIQSIITVLQSPTSNTAQLLSLLPPFYNALGSYLFCLKMDPSTLQLLLNLLIQLIIETPGSTGATGATGPIGPTGATGVGLSGVVPFNPADAPGYPAGQVVTIDGSTYIANVPSPDGTPGSSPDYTLIAGAGPTGPTGATGVGLSGVVPFNPADAPGYPAGQVVTIDGSTYIANVPSPDGTPGSSPDYTLIAGAGPTGPTGATGVGLSGVVPFNPADAPGYPAGQVVTIDGSTYIANVPSPDGTPGSSPDYTLIAGAGPTGPTGATGVGLSGVVPFNPADAPGYPAGQVVTIDGSTYIANVPSPDGTPGSSPDYTLIAGAGPTGPTGATGVGLSGVVPFNPADAPGYPAGQVVTIDGSTYIANVPSPDGTPGSSPDYTLIAGAGPTGPTGATGVGLSGVVPFNPADAPGYPAGQVVTIDGSTYIANVPSPDGTPGSSPDYTLIAGAGPTGPTGATGATGLDGTPGPTGATGLDGTPGPTGPTGATGVGLSGVVPFNPADAPGYPAGQVVTIDGSTYIANVPSPDGTPGSSPDYTLIAGAGPTGPTGATGATGLDGTPGATGATGLDGTPGATGATGLDGTPGATGATGLDGTPGATGATGLDGTPGATGATGLDGTPGATGATGLDGTPGATGATGLDGTPGPTGATGPSFFQDNAYIYLTTNATPGANVRIPYQGSNVNSPNGLIQYTNGSGNIVLAAGHTYFITVSSSFNGGIAGLRLLANGTVLPGSISGSGEVAFGSLSTQGIVKTTAVTTITVAFGQSGITALGGQCEVCVITLA
ncbi:collagen-like repeat preface domain-containing protein [Bacillus sp. IBL03825]|uniref:collagen-like repeat preface domain-containing protein n=1 Tax=Bacillus sp. IBL03825 TaxID=2953580 RepID=UPI00215826A6|nr:collagen-like repeat preface domain-containing protein [Bacillus sp. IBL03825]MCR6850438.1 collagen-like repeat preface domain-containing protein [Bacillus sp. IBL03825]